MIRTILFISFILLRVNPTTAQEYTLVIKGGHVVDPKNNIYGIMDVAITGGNAVKTKPITPVPLVTVVLVDRITGEPWS